jgi:solute carrier family 25 carnitine/acylcarnitine transporter 20/29
VLSDWLGAAGLIVGQPFDVVKVRYQTPEYAGRYSSTFKALGKLPRCSI